MIGGGSMAVNEKTTKEENKGFELETYFEFNGIQINSDEIIKRAREAYLAEGNSLDDVKSVKIYINANERRAYYVVNDQAESKFIEF
jgi:hypothetical protein